MATLLYQVYSLYSYNYPLIQALNVCMHVHCGGREYILPIIGIINFVTKVDSIHVKNLVLLYTLQRGVV